MESNSENLINVSSCDSTHNPIVQTLELTQNDQSSENVTFVDQTELITEPPVDVVLQESKVTSILEQTLHESLEDDVVFEYTNDDTLKEPEIEDIEGNNYKYTQVDKLDEDTPIPGQMYVLMSFISPERIMNCDIRGVKIRGVFESREKANKALEELKKKDKYFDIWLGEVGKWLPWNPNTSQAEEVKYRNKKLDKIMGKVHRTEMETLNELVGRRKDQLDKEKVAHKDRIKNSIKDAVRNYDNTQKEETTQESELKKPSDTKQKSKPSQQRNAEAIKERLRKTIEKRTETKTSVQNTKVEQENKTEELKVTSSEIEGKIKKMKELMKNRTK